jgi:hypothetical protein
VTTDELLNALRTALARRSDLRFAVLFGSVLRYAETRNGDRSR